MPPGVLLVSGAAEACAAVEGREGEEEEALPRPGGEGRGGGGGEEMEKECSSRTSRNSS